MKGRETHVSQAAYRLLNLLRMGHVDRQHAIVDRDIAYVLQVSQREVIDLAGELLDDGWLVIAETSAPFGRWLATKAGDLAAGRKYANSLGHRAVACWRRRKAIRAAIAATENRLRVHEDGQGWLFDQPGEPALALEVGR